jgi:hypothetical protein
MRSRRAGAHLFSLRGYHSVVKSTSARSIGYALRELGRRAGVTPEDIARWRFSVEPGRVVLYLHGQARATFPFDREKPCYTESLRHPPATFDDAIVPFEHRIGGGPLFAAVSSDELVCRADVLTATLWTLCRWEEQQAVARDQHARPIAQTSHAGTFGYLERPIVDEYGMAFQRALASLRPQWRPEKRSLRVKISHDIDLVGLPRRLRTTIGHLIARRSPQAFLADVASAVIQGPTAYLKAALELQRRSRLLHLTSAFYWMAAIDATPFDSAYDPRQPLVRRTIEALAEMGAEIGIHPGYDTFGAPDRLAAEVSRLREVVGNRSLGGRQHYLRWSPQTWRDWEEAGLSYDSSVGFADGMGFRAGTAHPYHPWLLDEDRESPVLEIPLIVMDCTPIAYMGLDEAETLVRIERLIERCRTAGGVFTLLWHNTSIIEQPYARLYPNILQLLRDGEQYDWIADAPIAPLPQSVEAAAC